ncbi:MAG: ATP-binding protein [Methanobrevibacter sp.]|nr:ATP-binding protein [Methanobrevibacter sp.]
MEIKEVYIQNFKSFEKCTIHFDDFYTAICGKNNSGKSNIIKAIFKVLGGYKFRASHTINDLPIWKENIEDIESLIKIKLLLRKKNDFGFLKFCEMVLKNEGRHDFEIKDTLIEITICQGDKIKNRKYKRNFSRIIIDGKEMNSDFGKREIFSRLNFEKVIIFHNSTSQNHEAFRRYRISKKSYHGEFKNLPNKTRESIDNEVIQIEKQVKSINKKLSESIQKNKSQLQDLIHMVDDKHDISLNFSDVDINVNIDYGRIPYEILLGEEDYKLSLENWGSGTQNRTLILNSIFHAKTVIEQDVESKITPLLIVEEPESFLHPSAQADFGRILQNLSEKLRIQVIVTTHSPYLLSHQNPNSNILVKRKVLDGNLRESYIEDVDNENWKEPFELALGMIGPEFDTMKKAFFSKNNSILFVEGDTDCEYFELMRNHQLGENKLNFEGEIYPYGGYGNIQNNVLLKFIKERFEEVIITFDLDVYEKLKKNLDSTGYVVNKDYFTVGTDHNGRESIEGLLPDFIKNKINSNNTDLIDAMGSSNNKTRKEAKNKLKKLYLKEFKRDIKYNEEYFGKFYELIDSINKRNDSL